MGGSEEQCPDVEKSTPARPEHPDHPEHPAFPAAAANAPPLYGSASVTFTITSLTRCAGQNHWHIDLNVTSPNLGTFRITLPLAEVQDSISSFEEARARIIDRCRSRCKEQGAGTFAQAKTALEGQTFQV